MSSQELARIKELNRQLAAEVSLAEERERRQIATDLHDHLGQGLAYIKVKLLQLRADAIFNGADGTWSEVMALLDQSIRYTRTLTCEISPPVLYELGLAPALEWLTAEFGKKRGLSVASDLPDRLDVAADMRVMIFKSVRELLLNVIRHAGVDAARLEASVNGSQVEIAVIDQGCGFEVGRIDSSNQPHGGFGLFSTRERMEALGGGLRLESTPGGGTTATLVAPLDAGGPS